jgi:hypothetical protein
LHGYFPGIKIAATQRFGSASHCRATGCSRNARSTEGKRRTVNERRNVIKTVVRKIQGNSKESKEGRNKEKSKEIGRNVWK